MSDIAITWKKITRGLPKIRRFADDRAPTIEEIRKFYKQIIRDYVYIVRSIISEQIIEDHIKLFYDRLKQI